jgi:hypothetical protein
VTKVFLDTNILVYAVDHRDPAKHDRAIDAVERHLRNGSGVISTQVMQESASVALNKLRQRVDVVVAELSVFESMESQTADAWTYSGAPDGNNLRLDRLGQQIGTIFQWNSRDSIYLSLLISSPKQIATMNVLSRFGPAIHSAQCPADFEALDRKSRSP